MARREELGHPLGTIAPPSPPAPRAPSGSLAAGAAAATATARLVVEVGTEELPPDDLEAGLEQLRCGRGCVCNV